MEFNIHTQAEGKYTFYVENENKELTLIGESDNLITKEGLEYVKDRRWCECFSTVRLGSADGGGSPVPFNSLTLSAEVAFATTPYANPGCGTYVTGSFDPAGTGITYVFFKSWRITNSSGADWVIKEVGACPEEPAVIKEVGDPAAGTALFSHSYLPTTSQVTVSADQAVITQYELRLTTKSVLSGKDMQFFTGGNSSWQIPNNQYGVTGCPFTFLKNSGTYLPVADVPAVGNGLFEPSTMDYYAGFIGKSSTTFLDTSADYVSDFYRARTEFQVLTASTILGPLYSTTDGLKGTQLNPAFTAPATSKWKLASLGNASHKFAQEPETKYVYERSWRITTAPVPNHELNGLFVSTHATVGATMAPPVINNTIAGNSWVMVFDGTWKRPVNTYLELSLKHTWAGTTPP
jgi:hypothetical protein